jgi:nicotinamidase-related amidase
MTTIASKTAIGKIIPQRTAFLLCDVQEKFRPLIYNMETVIRTTRYLTSIAQELKIPIICTQQYTKVFGPTVTDCFADSEFQRMHVPVFDKKKFSMLTDEGESHHGKWIYSL